MQSSTKISDSENVKSVNLGRNPQIWLVLFKCETEVTFPSDVLMYI